MEENIQAKQSVQTQVLEGFPLNRRIRVKKALPLKGYSHTYSKIVIDKLVRVGSGEKLETQSKYGEDEEVDGKKIEKNGRKNWKFWQKENLSYHISQSEKVSVRNSVNQFEIEMDSPLQVQPAKRKKSIRFNIPGDSLKSSASCMPTNSHLSSKKSMESTTIEEARLTKMREVPKEIEKYRQFPLRELDRYPLAFHYDGSQVPISKRLARKPVFFCRSMRIDASSLPRTTARTRPQIKTIHMDSYNALKCGKKQIRCQFPAGRMDSDIDKGWILSEGVTLVKQRDTQLL